MDSNNWNAKKNKEQDMRMQHLRSLWKEAIRLGRKLVSSPAGQSLQQKLNDLSLNSLKVVTEEYPFSMRTFLCSIQK